MMTKMDGSFKVIAVFMFVFIAEAATAGVFKWTDEHGQVHYGERPPENSANASKITIENAPPSAVDADERLFQYQKDWDKAMEERDIRKKEMAKAKKNDDVREKNCATAKSQFGFYDKTPRVFKTDENGQRQYLDDQQRSEKRVHAQGLVEKWCQ